MTPVKGSRRTAKPRRTARAAVPERSPRPSGAERALLALARTLTALASVESSPRAGVTTALNVLVTAFHAGAPLPGLLAEARIAALGNKRRALALAWAREQLRLSLGEILGRAAACDELHAGLDAEPLAWLVLAGCEALSDDPPQAGPDRIRLLAAWLTGAPADG